MQQFVLDTSALLAYLYDEPGITELADLLEHAASKKRDSPKLYLPFMSLMEIEYLLLRRQGRVRAEQILSILNAWPAERVESHERWRHAAAHVKASSSLSTADAWIASLALMLNARLIHKDPEFENVASLQMLQLPYRK